MILVAVQVQQSINKDYDEYHFWNSQMEFVANGQGEVTHLIIHGVEGDVPGERKPAQ